MKVRTEVQRGAWALAGCGVLYACLLFFAVRWGYPVAALWALVALLALGLGVIGRLMYLARRPERRWFRWERAVGVRLGAILYAVTVPFAVIEVSDGDRPEWGRLSFGIALVALIAMQSGQSWKDDDRVRELLEAGERLKVAVPVRWGRTSLWRRAVQGRFVVFTDRRILLFAYYRFWDVPVARPLWAELSADCTARLRAADRRLVLTGAGVQEFKVAAVRKADLERYAALMARV